MFWYNHFLKRKGWTMTLTKILIGLSFLIFFAGCSGDNTPLLDETPVIQASTGSFSTKPDSGFQLNLSGVGYRVNSADETQGVSTGDFLNGYSFDSESPAPAGILYGPNRMRVDVSLANPVYDFDNGTLQFDVIVPAGMDLPPNMENVEIRLEDCPDLNYLCVYNELEACGVGIGPVGTCWSWIGLTCSPCDCKKDIDRCTEANPKCCPDHDGCVPARLGEHGYNRSCL